MTLFCHGFMVLVKYYFRTVDEKSCAGYVSDMPETQNAIPSGRAYRTRGADYDVRAPVPKIRRTRLDLFKEHRIEMLAEARELGRAAATEFQIAQHFGVDTRTINQWAARDPEFAAAIRIGRDLADDMVERALYHKAMGYSYPSEKVFHSAETGVVRVPIIEHVPPDTTSMIFWLKNRRRSEWTDQQNIRVDGELTVKADPRALAIAMLATIRAALEAGEVPALTIDAEPAK